MADGSEPHFCAFQDVTLIARGSLAEVAAEVWSTLQRAPDRVVLVFDRETGKVVDLDLRGTLEDVSSRLAPPVAKRGRPKLGVVSREVTLLPRHWDWLEAQPGSASTAIRKLVDMARRSEANITRERNEAAYRFMVTMAGNFPNFEEAARVLFAGDLDRLETLVADWPPDIGNEVLDLAGGRRTTGGASPIHERDVAGGAS